VHKGTIRYIQNHSYFNSYSVLSYDLGPSTPCPAGEYRRAILTLFYFWYTYILGTRQLRAIKGRICVLENVYSATLGGGGGEGGDQ
jgi:hypothetical protein